MTVHAIECVVIDFAVRKPWRVWHIAKLAFFFRLAAAEDIRGIRIG
jgi:hypothetical protein